MSALLWVLLVVAAILSLMWLLDLLFGPDDRDGDQW